jgi:transcriptional antiterminator RfaH
LAGYAFYFPRVEPPRRRGSRRAPAPQLLFPGYGFVRIELQWSRANGCFGVHRLLANGGTGPVHVPDAIIEALRARERNGFVILPAKPSFRAGDAVRVTSGSFSGILGLYVGQSAHERVAILLGSLRATLPQDAIELAR